MKDDKKNIWIISGYDLRNKEALDPLEIRASSYDEALKIARVINRSYSGGQIKA